MPSGQADLPLESHGEGVRAPVLPSKAFEQVSFQPVSVGFHYPPSSSGGSWQVLTYLKKGTTTMMIIIMAMTASG